MTPFLRPLAMKKNGLLQPARKPLPKPIAKKSKKQRKQDTELKKQYDAYLAKEENKVCNIQIDAGCTYFATVVNHTRRRGANTLNQSDWEPSCSYCNIKIEQNDKWARENGHLKSKFNNHER